MNEKNLIVVPDDHYHKSENYTFLVYDVDSGELKYKIPENRELNCEELAGQGRPTFRPYGLTTDENFLYVASNKKLGKYNKKSFEYLGLVDVPMYINTHQILKTENTFYISHTAVNVIGIHGKDNKYFDVGTLKLVEKPNDPLGAETQDESHINSLFEHDNKIYFCLHNLDKKPSEFGYFDKETYESKIIAQAGSCCHEIRIVNNKLYSLSSQTGHIVEIDLSDNQVNLYKMVDSNKTFLRGMDVLDDTIIFAGSNRYSDGPIHMNNCFIASFDVHTKKAIKKFNIRDADIIKSLRLV